ncbi:hypothetical protein FKG94_08735 [Exilibacterium tricleocarpae]|uniref:Immunity MXAN-0049 protein domain-containing protein n=1 Tax=Exilibacterium tricleocarpae TaxID=2591008 RepID=A0A545TVE4_9GAMM|nr:DUF1629 domain-containing protein [Exilibacterium tricleocarpae]TQV81182.1 hypothetical protein FKG94_08735 [Exilibacterium tricleocarpae]
MALYSMYPDTDHYAFIGFDRQEVRAKQGRNPKKHIDLTCEPLVYKDRWQGLSVNLSDNSEGLTGDKIADIMPFKGKLFLSTKAYEVLKPLIENDGEFLSVTYERGQGYIFNPLSVAESVGGLNTDVSRKNEWNDTLAIAFHEDCVKDFAIFKTEFDLYQSVICQQSVKDAIEAAGLGGAYFTPDLGNPFTTRMSEVSRTN